MKTNHASRYKGLIAKMLCGIFLTFGQFQVDGQDVCQADTSFTDILFIIDNSQSIDDLEYEEFSNIIQQTISEVLQKCKSSQIGIVHYGGAFGAETFVQQSFSVINQINSIDRQFCTERNQFNNCSEGGGDDLNSAMGNVVTYIQDGSLNRNPVNKLAIVIFTDAFGFEDNCTFINCSVIRPFTNIDILKAQYGAQVTVVGASSQAEASLLAIYASPGGTFDNVDLFAADCPTTFDGCTMPRKYIPIEFDSPVQATADSIAVCVNCTIEIIVGVTANAGADQSLCIEEDVTAILSAELINGTPPLTFNWNQGLGNGNNFQVAPIITTTYSVTITDANGCQSSDDVTVFIEQCIPDCGAPPILTCPADTTLCPGSNISTDLLGLAVAMAGDPYCQNPEVSTHDSIVDVSSCHQIIYRIWTAIYPNDDSPIASSQCIQTISLIDNESPSWFNFPGDITIESGDNCTAEANWETPEAVDNCSVSNMFSNIPNGSSFDVGTTYVVYSASDPCGNVTVDSFAVNVILQCCLEGPVLYCPPDYSGCPMGSSDPAMTGMATATKQSQFCGEPIVTFSDVIKDFGDCDGAIIIKRTWIARDIDNPQLSTSCVQTISMVDTIAPRLLECPPDVVIDPDNPVHEWDDPRVEENCSFKLSYSVPNGSTFPTGDTEVLVVATDLCGNTDSCSFVITVPEEVQIICPEVVTLRCLDTIDFSMVPTPEVMSTCALCEDDPQNCIQVTSSIDTIIKDGGRTIYTITYEARDLCDTDNECTTQVIIDNEPFLDCPSDIIVQAPAFGFVNVSWDKPEFLTCCDACIPRQIPGFLYMGQLGDSYYYCSYARVKWGKARRLSEENGGYLVTINNAQENNFLAQRLIERNAYIGLTDEASEGDFEWVNGENSPYRRWKNSQPDNEGNEDFSEMDSQGYWYDVNGQTKREFVMEIEGCDPVIQIGGPASGSKFRPGTTTITYFAEDGCGESDECSFDIIVLPPVIAESFLPTLKVASRSQADVLPNPASSSFWINGNNRLIKDIELFNLNGQMVNRQLGVNTSDHQVNIESVQSGLYLLRLRMDDGQVEVHKIIIE